MAVSDLSNATRQDATFLAILQLQVKRQVTANEPDLISSTNGVVLYCIQD